MPPKNIDPSPPASIAERAITSRDGMLISEMVRQIAFGTAPTEERSAALQRIALYHADMPIVMIGALSTLSFIEPEAARGMAHAVLSEKVDRERELVYGAGARVLVETNSFSERDITTIARCLHSHLDAVRGETLRALRNMQHFTAAILLEKTQALQQTPSIARLVQVLAELTALRKATLPAIPAVAEPAVGLTIHPVETILNEKKTRAARTPKVKAAPARAPAPTPEPQPALPSNETEQPTPPAKEKRSTSPTLTQEQRCLLLPFTTPELRALSSADLADITAQERGPRRLFELLSELTLRNGRDMLNSYTDKVVWLTSTEFSAGNRDVRTLTEILFGD